jgi:hypothetical protein
MRKNLSEKGEKSLLLNENSMGSLILLRIISRLFDSIKGRRIRIH